MTTTSSYALKNHPPHHPLQTDAQVSNAVDLLRRMPPQKFEHVLQSVIDIAPDITEALLALVDVPMKIKRDEKAGRDYLLSEFNRDNDSYRSPWTNTYDPPCEDAVYPSDRLRAIEIDANNAFDQYREMYFEGGISSVYCWDLEQGFAMAVLIKKTGDASPANGCWDSIHIVEVQERPAAKTAHYKLSSTVMAWVSTNSEKSGASVIGGNISRSLEREGAIGEVSHIATIGSMIETLESQMRSVLNDVYFGTSKIIIDSMRSFISADEKQQRRTLAEGLNQAFQQNPPQ
ncbi:unnamed protein product [Schistocephalus solidus]|uniref:F-actin-capping protein subunit beta n=1 Tax=Schistocephalus solidus TaxID=70667 RepID=A0A183SNU8_SCHSO|nr:unnamed protein product [Schistocephalus solidus]